MSTQNIATQGIVIIADTNASASSLVYRDATGGITVNALVSTALQTTGTFRGNVSTQTASFTAGAATDYLCDATSGNITVTMPTASASTGIVYHFMKKDSSGNSISLSSVSGTSTTSTQYHSIRAFTDGTTWYGA